MSRFGAMFDPLAGADRVKVPPRCSCRDESHGHVVPCFRPATGNDGLCPHCRRGVSCKDQTCDICESSWPSVAACPRCEIRACDRCAMTYQGCPGCGD